MNKENMPVNGTQHENYWQTLADDEQLWYECAITGFPSVIAHEYRRLKDELSNGHPFAAMLQIKDVMEALLKFEVLLAWAWAAQEKADGFLEKVGCLITKESLSLGAWKSLGSELLGFFDDSEEKMPELLYHPLDTVIGFYGIK